MRRERKRVRTRNGKFNDSPLPLNFLGSVREIYSRRFVRRKRGIFGSKRSQLNPVGTPPGSI